MDCKMRPFIHYSTLVMLLWITATDAYYYCTFDSDCPTYADCSSFQCVCRYGGYTINGVTTCYYPTYSSTYVIIPSVVGLIIFAIVVGISIGVYCCLKKRRLARAQQAGVWVHSPATAGGGIPVAAQGYPPMYPAQQYAPFSPGQVPSPYYGQGINPVQPPPYTQEPKPNEQSTSHQGPNPNQQPSQS